jgi:catechol 2,3-dioxygenase-like lactoylglutathione lyase family enzyme
MIAMDRPTRIHHVALRVSDPERALRFYGGVLGLEEVRRFDGTAASDRSGSRWATRC